MVEKRANVRRKVEQEKRGEVEDGRGEGNRGRGTGRTRGKNKKMMRKRIRREGWPLLTVETKKNGDSKSTNDRSLSLVGSLC
jgi:hypothetical protein